ncbi:MAG: hypothetical protein IPG17_13605 [Sandaracinaceae bacterium]|nr:hypothetical protein [Sandaracinaceae bacterium]
MTRLQRSSPAPWRVCNGVDEDCDGVIERRAFENLYVDGRRRRIRLERARSDGVDDPRVCPALGMRRPQTTATTHRGWVAASTPSKREVRDPTMRDENRDGAVNEAAVVRRSALLQPCCGTRGTQTLSDDRRGGDLERVLGAHGGGEICNGIDDDWDTIRDEEGHRQLVRGSLPARSAPALIAGAPVGQQRAAAHANRTRRRAPSASGVHAGSAPAPSSDGGTFVCNVSPGTPVTEVPANGSDDNCRESRADDAANAPIYYPRL